jgi:hypothetical protein
MFRNCVLGIGSDLLGLRVQGCGEFGQIHVFTQMLTQAISAGEFAGVSQFLLGKNVTRECYDGNMITLFKEWVLEELVLVWRQALGLPIFPGTVWHDDLTSVSLDRKRHVALRLQVNHVCCALAFAPCTLFAQLIAHDIPYLNELINIMG